MESSSDGGGDWERIRYSTLGFVSYRPCHTYDDVYVTSCSCASVSAFETRQQIGLELFSHDFLKTHSRAAEQLKLLVPAPVFSFHIVCLVL